MPTSADERVTKKVVENIERRDFLSLSKRFGAVLALLGISPEAWAASSTSPAEIVINTAIDGGDPTKALDSPSAATLTVAQKNAIKSLSANDLMTLKNVKAKLTAAGLGSAADGTVVY